MVKGQLNPHVSVDCVVFGYGAESLKVLLVERDLVPAPGPAAPDFDLKLPGSLVYNDELLEGAARRVLFELTGLEGIVLKQFDVLDSLDRMSNRLDKEWLEQTTGMTIERVVSVAYYGLVSIEKSFRVSQNKKTRWVNLDQTKQLPFDHSEIILRAYRLLLNRLMTDDLVFGLLPRKFSISELQRVFQLFTGTPLDSRNFRKRLKGMDFIVPLDEKQKQVAHKPARLYRFDKKRFMQYRKEKSAGII